MTKYRRIATKKQKGGLVAAVVTFALIATCSALFAFIKSRKLAEEQYRFARTVQEQDLAGDSGMYVNNNMIEMVPNPMARTRQTATTTTAAGHTSAATAVSDADECYEEFAGADAIVSVQKFNLDAKGEGKKQTKRKKKGGGGPKSATLQANRAFSATPTSGTPSSGGGVKIVQIYGSEKDPNSLYQSGMESNALYSTFVEADDGGQGGETKDLPPPASSKEYLEVGADQSKRENEDAAAPYRLTDLEADQVYQSPVVTPDGRSRGGSKTQTHQRPKYMNIDDASGQVYSNVEA